MNIDEETPVNRTMTRLGRINLPSELHENDIYFVCIGTDRSTGDSLGPLVGTALKKLGYKNVIGNLDEPCHAMNLHKLLNEIPAGKTIVAIDSCLGQVTNVGRITANRGSLTPGSGVGKDLGSVGDYNIKGIVNVGGFMEYFVLQNTRLALVMRMADEIVSVINRHFRQSVMQEIATSREM